MYNWKQDTELDKGIRCKCGKYWGMKFFRQNKVCRRCKTEVIARGKK